ncbi:3-dehydroquinate synthase [Alteribacter populi]|uniref:3-dehydroquinate synthase n=1 Tax=Alteribacter populi TaxID=2011011 RepID=UPI000BBA5BDB|nr:3-dehydroquinate synthase [Alteribacter populi]
MESPILVQSSSHSYPVYIEAGLRHSLYDLLCRRASNLHSQYLVITDGRVKEYYLEDILASFPEECPVHTYAVPSGESSKSLSQYEDLLTYALEKELDRDSLIIALGGGVVGDLAGFLAATYMRGIDFVQVPTTLLAHDSSVGGKVGINHALGKNMIGAFHAPRGVYFDPEVFTTLPIKEWRSGLAEVIKHGLINDYSFYEWTINNIVPESIPDVETIVTLLKHSINIKKTIVENDEKERGIRAFLNFGHTLGHAIEAEAGYGKWTHGEAVVIGMVFALKLSEQHFQTDLKSEAVKKKLEKFGYQTHIPGNLSLNSLINRMKSDKKGKSGQIRFVLLTSFGSPALVSVSVEQLCKQFAMEVDADDSRN